MYQSLTFGVLLTIYVVGYLSGLATVCLWDALKIFNKD